MSDAPLLVTDTILEEHRRLRSAVARLHDALTTPASYATLRESVAAGLLGLRRQLAAHFAAEEREGVFEHIEERASEAAGLCARLRREHVDLLARLDRLRADMPPAWAAVGMLGAWAEAVRAALDALTDHEQRENDLLLDSLEPGAGSAPD
jgi:iron-sulfur cluster repair protein YtfE (RIC family)